MISLKDVTVGAGDFRLRNISFDIVEGRYCVLMGRTGSGKSTLLESICGLKPVLSGRILFGKRDVTMLKPAERAIGYVPQDGALFQTMSVRRHLEFALRIRGWSPSSIRERVDELAELVGVTHLLHRAPHGLSGGEAQRVALGRAMSFRPRVLCLDEPLSALDDESRQSIIELLKRVQLQTGVTALHVTHNRHEAEKLADFRLHVTDGKVIETDTFLSSNEK